MVQGSHAGCLDKAVKCIIFCRPHRILRGLKILNTQVGHKLQGVLVLEMGEVVGDDVLGTGHEIDFCGDGRAEREVDPGH